MRNVSSSLANKNKSGISDKIEATFCKLTENACSKCLFFGFYEVEIPLNIIMHEQKKRK